MSNLGLKQVLEAAVSDLRTYADEVDARGGSMSGEDQAALTLRMQAVSDAKKAVESDAAVKGSLSDAKAFMAKLGGGTDEQVSSAKQSVGSAFASAKSFGEMFVGSPAYGDFIKTFARGGIIPDSVKGIRSDVWSADMKALITGASDTSAGAAVTNDVYSSLTDLAPTREFTMRDLVTVSSTQSDTVEFAQVTSKTNAAAPVAEATSSATPTAPGTAGALVNVAGGGYKPESGMAFARVSAGVKTIAHWVPITKRAMADSGQVRTIVDVFLRDGLLDILDAQMLTGSGVGENLLGILNTPGILTVGSAGTDIDAIVDAIRSVRFTGRRRASGLVIHPNDWYSTGFLLAKDAANGRYLIGDPTKSVEQLQQLWGLKVVVSDAITEGTALVGDFRYAVLWEREGVNISVSDQHADFFIRNLLAILAEMRAAFGTLDPQAFCSVTSV